LLHLWSLGVEEQFYIAWPLILWWSQRRAWSSKKITFSILLISFILNLLIARRHPEADFYSPVTRVWELLIGAVLAQDNTIPNIRMKLHSRLIAIIPKKLSLIGTRNLPNVLSYLGIFLIAVGLLFINAQRPYPFAWGLFPVLGSALIIASDARSWVNRVLFGNGVAVWFGIISYPLYLWHWPLLSFARIVESDIPSGKTRALVVLVSILLAWLTYLLVERPVRFGRFAPTKTVCAVGLLCMTGTIGFLSYTANGFPSRFTSPIAAELINYSFYHGVSEEEFWGKGSCFNLTDDVAFFRLNGCENIVFPNRPTVFLVGDSHSAYLSLGLKPYLAKKKINLLQYSTAYCTPLSLDDGRDRCREINRHILDRIKNLRPNVVIIFVNYRNQDRNSQNLEKIPYDKFLLEKTREFKDWGINKVILLGQMPMWADPLPKLLLRRFVRLGRPIPERTFEGLDPISIQWDEKLRAQKYPDEVTYASLRESLCDGFGCLVKVGPRFGEDLIVFDGGHLTVSGASFVTENVLSHYLPQLQE
jgi:hypothetical protein